MNINEKIAAFEKICLMEAENKRLEILKEIDMKTNDEIDIFTNSEKASANDKLAKYENETKRHENLEISKANTEFNKKLLSKKEEYIDKLFQGAKKSLEDFAQSEEYLTELKKRVEKYLNKNPGSTVCLMEKDIERIDNAGFSFKERIYLSSVDFIGGFKGIPSGKKKIEDFTFYSRIAEEKLGFSLPENKEREILGGGE